MNETQNHTSTYSDIVDLGTTEGSLTGQNPHSAFFIAIFASFKYWPPILFAFGTFGNVMTIVVLHFMKSWDSSFNVFLVALAISDEMVLINGLFFNWVADAFEYSVRNQHIVPCKFISWLIDTFAKLSPWLLVALTFQRAVAVVWPHRVGVLCTRTRSLVLIGGLVLVSMGYHFHIFMNFEFVRYDNETVYCQYTTDNLELSFRIMEYTDIVFYALFPFACLLLSNSVLAWKLVVSVKTTGTSLTSGRSEQVSGRQKQASSTTLTVMVLSLAFVVFTLPICIFNLSYSDWSEVFGNELPSLQFAVSYFLAYCNNAVNFYLYCLTGTRFRNEFIRLMRCNPAIKRHQTSVKNESHGKMVISTVSSG